MGVLSLDTAALQPLPEHMPPRCPSQHSPRASQRSPRGTIDSTDMHSSHSSDQRAEQRSHRMVTFSYEFNAFREQVKAAASKTNSEATSLRRLSSTGSMGSLQRVSSQPTIRQEATLPGAMPLEQGRGTASPPKERRHNWCDNDDGGLDRGVSVNSRSKSHLQPHDNMLHPGRQARTAIRSEGHGWGNGEPMSEKSGALGTFTRRGQEHPVLARQRTRGLFPHAEEMKRKVRAGVFKEEYDVSKFYKQDGVAQLVARHILFEYATLAVIGLNALWIAFDLDHNPSEVPSESPAGFQFMESMFCVYFVFEIFVRFMAFEHARNAVHDGWFVFDSVLVFLAVLDTWVTSIVFALASESSGGFGNSSALRLLRLMRLTRMARMVRLLRAVPELMILIKGMWVGTRSVLLTLVLLAIIVYLFGIAFRQLTKHSAIGDQYFQSVPHSCFQLLLGGIVPDMADFVSAVARDSWFNTVLLLAFIFVASLTIMNMLIGILCEVVSVVASVEREQMTVNSVKANVLKVLKRNGIEISEHSHITRLQIEQLLVIPEAARQIQDVGVDVVGLVDYLDIIFGDAHELLFPDFFEALLQLRGTNTATVKDIVDLRKLLTQVVQMIHRQDEALSRPGSLAC